MIYYNQKCNQLLKEEIKNISTKENIPITEICKQLNILPQSYQNIYKKKNLAFSDIADILNILGYDLEIVFVKKGEKE